MKHTIIRKTVPAILITSFIFAMGHFSYDNPVVVVLDLAGVFIDSILSIGVAIFILIMALKNVKVVLDIFLEKNLIFLLIIHFMKMEG